jgi:hypothetical protein
VESEAEFEAYCLKRWREREMTFLPRTRRLEPDAMDRANGVWGKFVSECRATLPHNKQE